MGLLHDIHSEVCWLAMPPFNDGGGGGGGGGGEDDEANNGSEHTRNNVDNTKIENILQC